MGSETFIRIAINLIAVLIIMTVWFFLAAVDLYKHPLLPVYYPLGISLVSVCLFVLNKWLLKTSMPTTLVLIGLGIVIFLGVSKSLAANTLYRDVLQDYYETYHAYTLQQFPDYIRNDWNYVSVVNALKKSGVRVKTIDSGFGEGINTSELGRLRTLGQGVYLINGDTYVVFDWKDRQLKGTRSAASIIEEAVSYLEEDEQVDSVDAWSSSIFLHLTSGDLRDFDIYASEGEVKLLIE